MNTVTNSGKSSVDPITFEVIRHKLISVIEEQATTLRSVSGSRVVTEISDMNTGIYGPNGEVIAMGFHVLFHAGGMSQAIRHLISNFSDNPGFAEDDMFVVNDPYRGTVHQSDVMVIAPIIQNGEVLGWAGCCAHQLDVGGLVFGSFGLGATSIQQEGMLLPGIKLVEKGVIREDLWQLIMGMTRMPELVGLDLNGMIAANRVAIARFRALLDRYGRDIVTEVINTDIATTERKFRARLSNLPDGVFRATDYLEHDGNENRLYKICLSVEKCGDRLIADMTGSSPQAMGMVNCTMSGLTGAFLTGILPILAPDLRWNEGILKAIEIKAPEGTIVNAKRPAAVSGATISAMWSVMNATQAAVSRLAACGSDSGREACALSKGSFVVALLHGPNRDQSPFGELILDGMAGGGGAYSERDGLDPGADFGIPKPMIGNVETYEASSPYLYLYRTREVDTGGPGRTRGGVSCSMAITPYETSGFECNIASMGTTVPSSAGLMGGYAGSTNMLSFVSGNGQLTSVLGKVYSLKTMLDVGERHHYLAPKVPDFGIKLGDILGLCFQGGGGYGDPIERDPERVKSDVENGLVSAKAALRCYGVRLANNSVDVEATSKLRAGIRKDRLGGISPKRSLSNGVNGGMSVRLDETGALACQCGQNLGPADLNWKDAAITRVVAADDHGPMIRLRDELEIREHICPGCGTLLESELVRKDEPSLHTMKLSKVSRAA